MSERAQIHDIGARRAWVIWLVALSVYFLAVFHRSSLGVAGMLAADRFDINATSLSVFTVLQLVVYAGMQVPVGVLLDRFGSRVLLLSGLVLMTAGQFAFAFVDSFVPAVLARALMGAGDAMVFVSVVRLVAAWFLVRQAPLVTQLTGLVGQLGAIVAAAPLAFALDRLGWTRTFALASSIGMVLMVLVALLVKDSPYVREEVVRVKLRALAGSVRVVWGNPGTRLAFWSHFASPFSVSVFGLLWGYPFLVSGQGRSEAFAGTLLMIMTACAIVSGLGLAALIGRFPYWRSWIVVGVVVLIALAWTAVLVRSTPSPTWLLVLLVAVIATGGPASMVGFDLARTFNPVAVLGRANGLINVGGFVAALMTMGLIGVVLDLSSPGGIETYELIDFRRAMSVQYVFWLLGVVQILRYRHRALDHLRRVHPGAIEELKAGRLYAHPGEDGV